MEKVCCTTLPASLPLAWTRADRGLFLGMVEDAVQLTSTISTLGSMVYTRALLTRLERRQEIYPDHMGACARKCQSVSHETYLRSAPLIRLAIL